ncbi:Poly(A) polymerase [Thraustotheca clavata]|uniref:Poly(A) polymerase n=1 Tax=Thraustotheca clavata TaxID=74557 RepID=A0A1V9ZCJ5_9STRA|nr:Poly(A) polymerase [Thraustotheca clavata]
MGAINSVRRLTIQTIGLFEALEPSAEEITIKKQATAKMQSLVQEKWPHLYLRAFGSSENGFGCGTSDLDIGLFFEDPNEGITLSWNDRIQILASVGSILTQNTAMELEQFIYSARVPLLKFWDTQYKISIDISVGNPLALNNTQLLKQYGQVDSRVRPLVFAIKHWAKQRRINDASNGSLSSYAWINMVIFYLQTRTIPIVPCIPTDDTCCLVSGNPLTHLGSQEDSVGALLTGFFHYYAWEFDYKTDVVSIRAGTTLPKIGKWGLGLGTWRFSIEDPFDLQHDVGRVIFHPKGQLLLIDELRRAAKMALDPDCNLEAICAPVAESLCFICDSGRHAPRDCPEMWLTPTNPQIPSKPIVTKTSEVKAAKTIPKSTALDSKKRPRRRARSKSNPKKKMMLI